MTDKLPAPLSLLFTPRPPLRFFPATDHAPENRKTAHITGIGHYLQEIGNFDNDYKPKKTAQELRDERRQSKVRIQEERLKESLRDYDPAHDKMIRGDPYKTLFIARLDYNVTERDIAQVVGRFGDIAYIRIVRAKDTEKPRGYAFVTFEHERDMRAAYHELNGITIQGRKIIVDVERGRTVRGWKPRRLGGGLGGRHYTKESLSRRLDGRGGSGSGGGFRRSGDRYQADGGSSYRGERQDRRRGDERYAGRPRFRDDRPPPRGDSYRNAGVGYRSNAGANSHSWRASNGDRDDRKRRRFD